MGNCACLSVAEVSTLSQSALNALHEEDDFVISLFQQRLPISEICRVTSLQQYRIIGEGLVPPASAKPELQELALLCLQGSQQKQLDKHADVRSALMGEIKFLGGSDSTPEVQFAKSKLQVLCRIHDALLRESERERRRIAFSQSPSPKPTLRHRDSLPALSRVGLSFTLNMLTALIETVGEEKPQLLLRMIDICGELVPELVPLSLETASEAIQNSVTSVMRLLESVLERRYEGVDRQREHKALAVLLGLALARGDLVAILGIVFRLLSITPDSHWFSSVSTVVRVVAPLRAMKPKGLAMKWTWNTARTGPNIVISNDGHTITRSSGSGWSCNLSEQSVTRGIHYIEFLIERSDSPALLLGIASKSYESLNRNCCKNDVICYQSDGDCYVNGSGEGNIGAFSQGDRVGMVVNMENHSVVFVRNGVRLGREEIRPAADEVTLIVCLGGGEQLVTILQEPSVPQEFESQVLSVNLTPPSLEQSSFATNSFLVLEDASFRSLAAGEATGAETPLEVAAFLLTNLDALNEGVFAEFRLDSIQTKFPKFANLVKTYGLSLAVSPSTFSLLLRLLVSIQRELLQSPRSPFRLLTWSALSCLRLLRSHIYTTKVLSIPDSDSGLSDSIKESIHAVLRFFAKVTTDTIGVDNCEENVKAVETVNATATLVVIHSFELLYPSSSSQLDFVLAGIDSEMMDEKRLVSEVLKKLSIPTTLLHAFDPSTVENRTRVARFLATLLEKATEQSLEALSGGGSQDESIMACLYVAQGVRTVMRPCAAMHVCEFAESVHRDAQRAERKRESPTVLVSHMARSSEFLSVFHSYFAQFLSSAHRLLQHAKDATSGKLTDHYESLIKKSILGAHCISFLRALSLLRFSSDFSARLIPEILQLNSKLSQFTGGRLEHVRGVATVKQIFESEHPYPDNADLTYNIDIPGAIYYVLSFDPQCKSERNYDYLELWTDEEHSSRLFRWEGDTWPSEPLVVKQRTLHFSFHSDQSSNFWGWKIEISARVQVPMTKDCWADELRNCCTVFLISLCQNLVRVSPKPESHSFLTSRLIRSGISDRGAYRILGERQEVSTALRELVEKTHMEDRLPVPLTSTGLLQLTVFKSLLPKRLVTRPALSAYLAQLSSASDVQTRYCDSAVLDEFISGSARALAAFREMKRQAKVTGMHANIGGEEMDQAERAVCAVVFAFFELTDTLAEFFESCPDLCEMVKYVVKQCCKIRQWAQVRRQKLANESPLAYSEIGKEVVEKCVILLHTDYKQSLTEIGIEKVLRSLSISASQKPKSGKLSPVKVSSTARLRSGSKWTTIQKAVSTMRRLTTLQELRNTGRKAEPEHGDISEFTKIWDLIIDVMETKAQARGLMEEIRERRNKAVARAVGLQILFTTAKAAPILNKGETQGVLSGAFSEAFIAGEEKQHFTEGVEGVDPFLNACLRRSFFQLYQLLLERLQVNAVSELDCTSSSVFHYMMHTMDALNFPFEDQDAYSLLDLRIRESVNLLLNWSKGQRIFQHIPVVFDTSKTITDFRVHKEGEYRANSRKEAFSLHPKNRLDGEVADEVEGQTKLTLEVIRGPYPVDLLPIHDAIVAPSGSVFEGYTKIPGNVNEIGEELNLFVRREKPKEGGQYLVKVTVIGWNPVVLDFSYKPYDSFLVEYTSDDDKEQRTTRKLLLKRGAWLLFKMLTYTAAGKSEDSQTLSRSNNRFKLQELFAELIFSELKWLPQQSETKKALALRKLLSGKNWRNKEIPLIELKTNPVVEWVEKIREDANEFLFRAAAAGEEVNPFEVSLMDNVNDYITSTDPCLQGVLGADDLPEGLADIPEEYFNTKKQVDFFCFLRHIVCHIDTAVSPFWAKNVKTSALYQNLPIDFYEAKARCGEGDIPSILHVFRSTLNRNSGDSFGRYLDIFASADTPGVVPADKIPEGTPNDFLNEDRQLDFFTALKAIRDNEVKFSAYFKEIKPLMRSYSVLPPSCSGFYRVRLSGSQMEYQASLLLVIYQCCGFQGMLRVLAKSSHLVELLKHMLMGSTKSSTISFRIIREILFSQHSPDSFPGIWSSLPKGKLKSEYGTEATKDFTIALFTFIGIHTVIHTKSWRHAYVPLRKTQILSQESLDLLLFLSRNEDWARYIVTVAGKLIGSHGRSEWEAVVGALVLLKSAKEGAGEAREWGKVELRNADVSQATIVAWEEDECEVKLYCEADDAVHKEQKEKIIRPVSEFAFPLLAKLPSDLANSLFSALISLYLHIAGTKPSDSSAESRLSTLSLHRSCKIHVLSILSQLIDARYDLPSDSISSLLTALLQEFDSDSAPPSAYESLRRILFTRYQSEMTALLRRLVAGNKRTALVSEEEEAKIIKKYSDEQQFLIGMMKNMGLSLSAIREAIDAGCSDTNAVLSSLALRLREGTTPTKGDFPLLYKLSRDEGNLARLKDCSGTATSRELPSGQLTIAGSCSVSEPIELTKRLEEAIFGSEDKPVEEITILATVGYEGNCPEPLFGLVVGRLRVHADRNTQNCALRRKCAFRLFVRFTGRVVVTEEPTGRVVTEAESALFLEDISQTSFGLFLCSPGEASLLGFAIYLNHYPYSPQYCCEAATPAVTHCGLLVDYERKSANLTEAALESLLGLNKSAFADIDSAIRHVAGEETEEKPLEIDYGRIIADCLIVNSREEVPTDYSVVEIHRESGEFGEDRDYSGPLFAVKMTNCTDKSYVRDIAWKNSQFLVHKDEKGEGVPLTAIAVLSVSDTKQVTIPHGFSVLSVNSKAVNLTPSSGKTYFLALSHSFHMRRLPLRALTQIPKRYSDFGLIDSFSSSNSASESVTADSAEDSGKFTTLSVVQLQARLARMERASISQASFRLVLMAVQRWTKIVTDCALLERLLKHAGSGFLQLFPTVSSLLQEAETAQRASEALWFDCLSSLCRGALTPLQSQQRTKQVAYESAHPYENNLDLKEEICIPGAEKLQFSFDSQCRCETNYDFLLIALDKDMESVVCRQTGTAWSAVEVQGDTAYAWFHSDISNNEWGYKYTVSGVIPGDEATNDGVLRALWLLESVLTVDSAYFPRNLSQLLLISLTLLAHNTTDHSQTLRCFSLIRRILRSPTFGTLPSREILTLLTQETTSLYAQESSSPKKSEILIAAIEIITELAEKCETALREEWFEEFYESYSLLRGVVEKNEDFQVRIVREFLERSGKSLEVTRESAHPYSLQVSTKEVCVPGASSLLLRFSPDSAFHPAHSFLLSRDFLCSSPIQTPPTSIANYRNAVWDSEVKGPDIAVVSSGKAVTRTSSSGWGCAVLNTTFDSGKIRVCLRVDSHDESNYLYIGLVEQGTFPLNACMNKDSEQAVWTYKANGEVHKTGFCVEVPGAKIATGDSVAICIDFDGKTISFQKNTEEIYSFTDNIPPVTAVVCFGGNSQRVSLVAIDQYQSEPIKFANYTATIPGDRFYYHFPANSGFVSMLYASWRPEKHPLVRFSNKDLTVTRKASGDSSQIGVYTSSVLRAGRHFLEVKFPVLSSGGSVAVIISPIGGSDCLFEYKNSGLVVKSGEKTAVDGFAAGDSVAAYLNIASSEVRLYKNGQQISQSMRVCMEVGKEYRWGIATTGEIQAEIVKNSPLVESLGLTGRNSVESPLDISKFGYKFTVTPIYKGKNKRNVFAALGDSQSAWESYYKTQKALFATEICEQLVNYIDEKTIQTHTDPVALREEDIEPSPQELLHFPLLEKVGLEDIRVIFSVIRDLNVCASKILPLISLDLREGSGGLSEIQRTVLALRGSIFLVRKQNILREFLSKTHTSDRLSLEVNRTRASRQREKGLIDTQGVSSIFGQLFRKLNLLPNRSLRSEERVFQANFIGEGAIDAGGPYNEVISSICEELQSPYVPLLTKCPNGVHSLGDNRDAFIPSPAADSPLHYDMYLFLGKLLGIAIRTKNNMNLSLAPLFWKRLVYESVGEMDLKGFDECVFQTLDILRHMEEQGIGSDNFEMAFGGETFTTVDSAARTVELMAGGKNVMLTYTNAREYADLLEKQRLSEADAAYKAIRKGLSAVIPLNLLYLFSWKQVETLVCGAPDINIEILRSKTIYEGFDPCSEQIVHFWAIMRELSSKDRSLFLRFVWGRSKLPTGTEFRPFKIARKVVSGDPDQYLPLSHTCFFTLDLPLYSSKYAMRDKLIYAITHCQAIDLDRIAGAEGKMSMNWIELEDLNYRQVHVYDLEWETQLPISHFQVAAAKFGGPIARVLKPKSLVKSDSASLTSAKNLTIHSASGHQYSKIPWNNDKPMVGLGWTADETLVIVYRDGSLDFYNIWAEKVAFPPENIFAPRSLEVLKFQVLDNTLVLFANDGCFYTIRGVPQCNSFAPEMFYRLNSKLPPKCFLAFSDPNSLGFDMQLIIGLAEGGIKLINESQKDGASYNKVPFSTDENMTVSNIAISGNSTMFAFLLDSGTVLVVPSDLSKLLGKQTVDRRDIEQIIWCGSDAVCLAYSRFLAILGPNDSYAQMDYATETTGVACLSEVDGLRIITTEHHEFLEKVDKSVESIFSIGVFTPASLLKTAYELYLSQNSGSGDTIRNLQQDDQLLDAVETCISAACCEFSTENQEILLKTASFGKTFLPIKSFDSNKFVETVRNLRVLNNIRKQEVARPLTYRQLSVMRHNGELLIRRLLDSHHHYLALQIAKLWKLREEQIYVHWACAKLSDQQYSDTEMCEIIYAKLSNCKGISYTEITRKALDCGRRDLAIKLLENEPIIARKVPLLLYMNEVPLALDKAIESMNPNLIYLVIMKAHEEERLARTDPSYSPGTSANMEQVIRKPVAREMLLNYAKLMDESLLLSANKVLKRSIETGNLYLEKAIATSDLSVKLKSLKSAEMVYQSYDRDPFYFAVVKDQQMLIEKQKKVGKETSVLSITGGSVSVCETIYQLLMERHQGAAEAIAKAFQVPEKKFWYIKVRVWTAKDDWAEFENALNTKKAPPIGYKPLADLSAKRGNYDMAEKCILKVNEPDYQVTMLMFLGKFMSAAQVAVRAKNFDILPEIMKQCTDPEVRGFIDSAMTSKGR